jgi:hypothetical protein
LIPVSKRYLLVDWKSKMRLDLAEAEDVKVGNVKVGNVKEDPRL